MKQTVLLTTISIVVLVLYIVFVILYWPVLNLTDATQERILTSIKGAATAAETSRIAEGAIVTIWGATRTGAKFFAFSGIVAFLNLIFLIIVNKKLRRLAKECSIN